MRSPSNGRPPSGGGAAAAAGDDDFAFYCSFLQDTAAASVTSPLALALDDPNPTATATVAMTNGRRRKQRGAADGGGAAGEDDDEEEVKKEGKKRSIAKLLTSLAALEAEEHADRAGAADASRRELALLESNVNTRSEAMMYYYAKMESSFDAIAESEAITRSKRSRVLSYLISPATSLHHCNICSICLKHNSIVIATYAIFRSTYATSR